MWCGVFGAIYFKGVCGGGGGGYLSSPDRKIGADRKSGTFRSCSSRKLRVGADFRGHLPILATYRITSTPGTYVTRMNFVTVDPIQTQQNGLRSELFAIRAQEKMRC